MAAKLYPFSVQKHAHDIEFARNRTRNLMSEIELEERKATSEEYNAICDRYEALTSLLLAVLDNRDGRTAYLTGPQIALAKECILWASNTRAERLIAADKIGYLQYT